MMNENKLIMALNAATTKETEKGFADACEDGEFVYVAIENMEEKMETPRHACMIDDGSFGCELIVLTEKEQADKAVEMGFPFKAVTFRELLDWMAAHEGLAEGICFFKDFEEGITCGEVSWSFLYDVFVEVNRRNGKIILDLNKEIRFFMVKIGCTEEEAKMFFDAEEVYLEEKGVVVMEGVDEPEEPITIDTDDMVKFISEITGMSYDLVDRMAEVDLEFQEKIGLVREV